MKRSILTLFIASAASFCQAQLNVSTALTPQQLVQDVLVGGGVGVSNITYNGSVVSQPQDGSGSFSNGASTNLGLNEGIILSSGLASSIPQAASNFASDITGTGSDPDLLAITTPGNIIKDRAVLEFDFIPTGDSLKFSYVFGSEEYPGYDCSAMFNDVFGFFISGPGFNGPYTNNAVNLALVPGTNLPVGIANIHGSDASGGCGPSNDQYYVINTSGTTIVFGGFTTVLEAQAQVVCGATYHIKLAIGDSGDDGYNSGVFLQAGSFASTGHVEPTLGTGVNMPNDSTIIEGCGEVPFSFRRIGDTTNTDTIHLTVGGTSTPGVDYYPAFPAELIFQPGDTVINFPLNFPFDADGIETLTIELVQVLACSGLEVTNDYTFYIDQFPTLYVFTPDVQGQCQQSYVIAPVQEGGTGSYGFVWSTGETTPAITVSVDATTTFYVTVTDTCSVLPVTDSITVFIPAHPPLQLESETPIKLHCDQDSILLTATYGGGYGELDIHWGETSPIVEGDQLWVPGEQDGDYIVSVSDECQSSTSQLVHVDAGCEVIIPNVITPNGDGSNDAFVIKGILGRENHVQIFDRWGISVLDVYNYQNNFKAKDLPDGVYFYNIQVLDKKYTGTLTVLGNK